MKEGDWLVCNDPQKMLVTAQRNKLCRQGERIWRLLACAAARRAWAHLDAVYRQAVETAERFADGQVKAKEMQSADREAIRQQTKMCRGYGIARWTLWGPWRGFDTIFKAMKTGLELGVGIGPPGEASQQAVLIRDIFGNPFQTSAIDPAWITPRVRKLATGIYNAPLRPSGEFAPKKLENLAAALEKVGCDQMAILNHLRSTNPHVRGCWAIDLLRGD